MKCKLILTLLIFVIFGLVLFYGCGGSEGISEPASIAEQDNNTDGAYLNVQVVWPQNGMEGSLVISSGSEDNSITASMPGGTVYIKIKVRHVSDDPNSNLLNGFAILNALAGEDKRTLGPLPAVRVIVRAEAFDAATGTKPVSVAEHEMQLKLGQNPVGLNLGDYKLTLIAEPVISGLTSSWVAPDETPTPEPTLTPMPTETPMPPTATPTTIILLRLHFQLHIRLPEVNLLQHLYFLEIKKSILR